MITLKEVFHKEDKEEVYNFYQRIVPNPATYQKITRDLAYKKILELYQEDPEVILRLCSLEEINILKNLLDENLPKKDKGYIEYLLISNLKSNYLVFEAESDYYIPKDLVNYIKMAINLYEEREYAFRDLNDGLIIGLIRIYNVLDLDTFKEILTSYGVVLGIDIKKYISTNPKLKSKLMIKKYQKVNYVVSLENEFYREVLGLRQNKEIKCNYSLEEIVSVGKYKINLFNERILKFLNFLEMHLEPIYTDQVVNELIIYSGLEIDDLRVLKVIADNIEPLYQALEKIVKVMPSWIMEKNNK